MQLQLIFFLVVLGGVKCFHTQPLFQGQPESPHNCLVTNKTLQSLTIECQSGYSNSFPQVFHLEIYSPDPKQIVANRTRLNKPWFQVTDLSPGTNYIMVIYASNLEGRRSNSVALFASTLSAAEERTAFVGAEQQELEREQEQEQKQEEEKCGSEKVDECIENFLFTVLNEEGEEEFCRVLKETSQCFEETADECFGENKHAKLENSLQKFRQIVAMRCPRSDGDVSDDIEQCVTGLEGELMECVSDSVADALQTIIQLPADEEPDEKDIKCSMYESVTKCVVKKVEDSCGAEAAQIALAQMVDAPEEIKKICQVSNARESLEGLIHDIAKRRKK